MEYRIVLNEVKVKPHQIATLHLFSAIAFILIAAGVYGLVVHAETPFHILNLDKSLATNLPIILVYACTGLFITGSILFKNAWATSKKINNTFRVKELVLSAVAAIVFYIDKVYFLAVPMAINALAVFYALYAENATVPQVKVLVNGQGIFPPAGLRSRLLKWEEVDNVLLRNGTLSVNCVDNRFYQWTFKSYDFDVQAFQQFCTQQIEKATPKRASDW